MNENGKLPASSNHSQSDDLLISALEGKSQEFKRKVMDFVGKSGLDETDPLFLVLLATGRLEVLLEEAPEALERLFKGWTAEIRRSFDLVDHALIERQKLAITEAAGDLIRTAERQQAERFFTSLVPAVAVLLAVLGLGFVMGITVPPWLQGGYLEEPIKLTYKQYEALRWLESQEGQLARNIVKWNQADISTCLAAQRDLRLTYQGREIKYGICALWIVPPQQRKFGK